MPRPIALPIVLSQPQKDSLEQIIRCHTSEQRLVRRAQIILKAHDGLSNAQIARDLSINRETVQLWRQRWRDAAESLSILKTDNISNKAFQQRVQGILTDLPRPGAPAVFSAQQVVCIVALACEDPQEAGVPVTEWTPRELAAEAKKRGIVEGISARSVGRFLKGSRAAAPSESILAQC